MNWLRAADSLYGGTHNAAPQAVLAGAAGSADLRGARLARVLDEELSRRVRWPRGSMLAFTQTHHR